MKKHMMMILALALAALLGCGCGLADVRTVANVNVRSGPGLDYDIVTSCTAGKALDYMDQSQADDRDVIWYRVSIGNKTGWVSSKYTELVGEDAQPADAAMDVGPTPAPKSGGQAGLPALNAGNLFAQSLSGEPAPTEAPVDITPTEAPVDVAPTPTPAPAPATGDGTAVELSVWYRADLVTAANEIGLISYRQVQSEAPYQYYDDALILAGNQNVENIVVYGPGYEIYGVRVGMNANAAMACLNAAGLDYLSFANGIAYEHRAVDGVYFSDANGHDSVINVWVNEENVVTEIDWSTYTG